MRELALPVLLSCILAGGCALGPSYFVQVNGFAAPESSKAKTFILAPGAEGVSVADLQFREFARYVAAALTKRGFQEAPDATAADVAIFLSYGIGDPQRHVSTYTVPVYGEIGGGTSSISLSTFGTEGWSTTTGTITTPSTYGQVGSRAETETQVTYFRYLIVDAWDLDEFRRSNKALPVWKTIVTSTGRSGDLRLVFPILVAASESQFGINTGKQIHVTISGTDPRVTELTSVH